MLQDKPKAINYQQKTKLTLCINNRKVTLRNLSPASYCDAAFIS